MTDREMPELILAKVTPLETQTGAQEAAADERREDVDHYNIILENMAEKCVQTMGKGIQLNAKRFDRLDIDSVRLKVDTAYLIAKAAHEKIQAMMST